MAKAIDILATTQQLIIQLWHHPHRLQGTELVDCARANAKQELNRRPPVWLSGGRSQTPLPGRTEAAFRANEFTSYELSELITDQEMLPQLGGGVRWLRPDTPSELMLFLNSDYLNRKITPS